ncbi:MAG: M15 family metallopeptidase [Bacteroidota bacterium]
MKIFKSSSIYIIVLLVLMIVYYLILQKDKFNRTKNIAITAQTDTAVANNKPKTNIFDTAVSIAFLTGKFNPSKDTSFTLIDSEYAGKSDMYLLRDTYKAFIKMFYAAQHDGVKIFIISATRNFNYQKNIWEQKWNGSRFVDGKNLATTINDPVKRAEMILKYSSMPGISRHHWGTDIDLNSMDDKYFATPVGIKVYDWLCSNASKYGFCNPFNSKNDRPNGYDEEKWHWSYMPLAKNFLHEYEKKITYSDITGFAGHETASKLQVINNYVLCINKECQ